MPVIIGATLASLIFVLLLIILVMVICCCCRKKGGSENDPDESYKGQKLQNHQLNNSKGNYPYQYEHTSNGMNGGSANVNGNGKVAYSELENGHADTYR